MYLIRSTRDKEEIKNEVRLSRKRKAEEVVKDDTSVDSPPLNSNPSGEEEGVENAPVMTVLVEPSPDQEYSGSQEERSSLEQKNAIPAKRSTRASKIQRKSTRKSLVDCTNQQTA